MTRAGALGWLLVATGMLGVTALLLRSPLWERSGVIALASAPPRATSTGDRAPPREVVASETAPLPQQLIHHGDRLDAWIRSVLDPEADFGDRVDAAEALSRLGSDEAVSVLERVLASGDSFPLLRAAIAEALGLSTHPRARELLDELLAANDSVVAAGAVRGLAVRGGPELVSLLADLLSNPDRPLDVREQAAISLGASGDPRSMTLLANALRGQPDGGFAASLLQGLATLPFPTTEDVFRQLLADPTAEDDLQLTAIEALAEASPEAAGLLLEIAQGDPRAEHRSAAASSLALLEDPALALAGLRALLPSETDPRVRAEIYRALAFNWDAASAGADLPALAAIVLDEASPAAKVEGARLLGHLAGRGSNDALAAVVDRELVGWLEIQASESAAPRTRVRAVEALTLAATSVALDALERLTRSPDLAVARAAERGIVLAEMFRREKTH